MKRKALVTTLSLVMCLLMSFPASAAYTVIDTRGLITKMNTIKQQAKTALPSGYDYVLFCITQNSKYSSTSNSGIYAYFSNTPVLTVGSKYYVGSIASSNGNIILTSNRFNAITKISSVPSTGAVSIDYTLDGVGTVYNGGVYGVFASHSTLSISGYNTDRTLAAGYDWFINFVPTVDPSALQTLIAQAKAKQNIGYTQSSWNALQTQITAADNLLKTSGYTQAQVDSAKNALQAALNGLMLLPDTPDLAALLIEADAIEDVGYTAATWTHFTNSKNSSHALLLSKDYTQSQLNYSYNELQSAMFGLTLIPPPEPPDPPKPEPAPLGYDLMTGDISGYLSVMPRITYGYIDTMKPIFMGIFGIIISILIIPRLLAIIIPHLRR